MRTNLKNNKKKLPPTIEAASELCLGNRDQTTPWAIMALATFTKPPMLAPFT